MIVMEHVQRLMRQCHLWYEPDQSCTYRLFRCVFLCVLLMLVQPQFAFLCRNLDNVILATDVSIQLVSELMAASKIFAYLYNRRVVKEMLDTCQWQFEQLERCGRPQRFVAAEREVTSVTRFNNGMLMLAGVSHCGIPLVIMLLQYVRFGALTPDMWAHPFNCVYAFDHRRLPGYVFSYLLAIAYNASVAYCYACNDMMYLGLCRYAVAQLECLVDDFGAMDRAYVRAGRSERSKWAADADLERDMKNCIRTYVRVLEFLDKLAASQACVIFAQFLGVIIVLSTLAFQTTINDNNAARIMYAVPAVCVLLELFIYCYYGNLLTTKSLDCATDIWQSIAWYTYPVRVQKLYRLTIQRLQSSIVLSGFGFVDCTLDIFVATIKMVCSVMTLLQSMEDI